MKKIKASECDKKFDAREGVSAWTDFSKVRKLHPLKRVHVDFSAGMVNGLDRQAGHLSPTCPAPLKVWISDRLVQKQTGARR